MLLTIITAIISLLIGAILGYLFRKSTAEAKIKSAEEEAVKIVEEGKRAADNTKREALVEAREEVQKMRAELNQEIKERRLESQQTERRLLQREEVLDRRTENLERKEENIARKETDLKKQKAELQELYDKQLKELERLASLTSDEARELLLNQVRDEVETDMARIIRDAEEKTKDESEKKAQEIISVAIQRCAADHVAETTVSVVNLPNDEMKGRIIGREGRNIRALESLTGINLIIDDTPEAVILSGFDPIRRETARLALEKLIQDGRIHPARIEEMVEKSRKEIDTTIREQGEQATFEVGVHGIHPELIRYVGRLYYRTSYGQNVLKHSVEVAHLAALMAADLGVDVNIAKRAGLLHDIGKAADQDVEGTHHQISADLAKRYKESPEVVHAILAHHGDVEAKTVEAVLVAAADAISAARPGARRETLESYIKRLEKLEAIADGFDGVDKSYAIQAGREIRIIVKPDRVDDVHSTLLARDISKKIEEELEYPGQIKITVIRETRAVEYAK
ncbi:MAG: ribonuclease Y [Firmicutes bacterium]|nr:ribonuclease Y [Bacillota bacterium]MDD4693130.1 ribonuclease Y [Bacillota bacterium]